VPDPNDLSLRIHMKRVLRRLGPPRLLLTWVLRKP
jgi:hypothetical protein